MLKNSPKLKRLAEITILTISLAYIIHILTVDSGSVMSHLDHVQWPLLLVAMLGFWVYFLSRAAAWWLMLGYLGGPMPLPQAGQQWFVSEFSRFVPGNVWSFLSRVYMAGKAGVEKHIVAIGIFVEIVILVGSAALFAPLYFWLAPYQPFVGFHWLVLLIIPFALVLLLPKPFTAGLNAILRLAKQPPLAHRLTSLQLAGLLCVYLTAWLAFGFASLETAKALVGSVPASPYWIISVFVMALLVGYLSFITPMGLGVREGAIMLLLGPVMPVSLAGLVAVGTRVWMIVSELIIMGAISFSSLRQLWQTHKREWKDWLIAHWPEISLGIAILLFIGYFFTYDTLRHYHFYSRQYDLGNMDQVVWNSGHGSFFQATDPAGASVISRFKYHADIFLVLLAPLYWIIASPLVLLFVQAAIVALGAIPLYWLGRDVLKNKQLAFLVSVAYLMYPPLQNAVIFDFHAVTLVTTFFLFAFYYLYKRRYWRFAFFAILALSTKETMAFLVIMLGIYAILAQKNWRVGLPTIGLSAFWFYLLLWHIMPGSRGGGSAHFALSYYSQLGSTPGQIIGNIFLKPGIWFRDVLTRDQAHYLFDLLAPTGFLALLSPLLLLAAPEFAVNMFSNAYPMHTIFYQYTSGITPFIFIAMVFGLQRFRQIILPRLQRLRPRFVSGQGAQAAAIYCVFAIGLATFLWSPLPGMRKADVDGFFVRLPDSEPYLHELEKTIPRSASVSASMDLEPHFSERNTIYGFPFGVGNVDYVVYERDYGSELFYGLNKAVHALEKNPSYIMIYRDNVVEVFQKVAPNQDGIES